MLSRKITILFLSSSVVERSTVNRLVIGSNPIWGEPISVVGEHLSDTNENGFEKKLHHVK